MGNGNRNHDVTWAAYVNISRRRGLHLEATASLWEEFQRLRGSAAGRDGRNDQRDEWRRWGG